MGSTRLSWAPSTNTERRGPETPSTSELGAPVSGVIFRVRAREDCTTERISLMESAGQAIAAHAERAQIDNAGEIELRRRLLWSEELRAGGMAVL